MRYVYLLTENSLANVGVLRKLFRKLAIGVYPYNRVNGAGTMQPLNKALSVFISPILEIPPIPLHLHAWLQHISFTPVRTSILLKVVVHIVKI